jgi:hypothetical protein
MPRETSDKKLPAKAWKKGQSGNPKGRPKIRQDLKNVKVMTNTEVSALLWRLMSKTTEELRLMVEDPETPAMELMVARIIDKGLLEGDPQRLNFLLDRTIGKVIDKREVEVTPVVYKTRIEKDGTLVQDVLREEVEGSGET